MPALIKGPSQSPVPERPERQLAPQTSDPTQMRESAREALPADSDIGPAAGMGLTLGLSGPDLVDQVSSSVGLTERGELMESMLNGMPRINEFYADNKGAIEGVTLIPEIMFSAHIGGRFVKGAGTLGKAIRLMPGGGRLVDAELRMQRALINVRRADIQLARKGAMTTDEMFRGAVTFGGKETTRSALFSQAKRAATTRGVVQGAAAETVLFGGFNTNEWLYDQESQATNVFLASLGIAIPGFVDNIAASYVMRRYSHAQDLGRVAAEQIDPSGLSILPSVETMSFKGKAGTIPASGIVHTDEATRSLLSAHAMDASEEGIGSTLKVNRNSMRNQMLTRAYRELDQVSREGILGNKGTGVMVSAKSPDKAVHEHVRLLNRNDPLWAFGVEEIGTLPANRSIDELINMRTVELDRLEAKAISALESAAKGDDPAAKKAAQAQLLEIGRKRKLIPVVYRNGEPIPSTDPIVRQPLYEGPIVQESIGTGVEDYRIWKATTAGVSVDTNGKALLPKGAIHKMDYQQTNALYQVSNKALNHLAAKAKPRLNLSKNPSWFELDFAEELLKRNPRAMINWPESFAIRGNPREVAAVESIAQKIDVLKALGKKAADSTILREQLNLPKLSSYERAVLGTNDSAVDILMRGSNDGNSIRQYHLTDIERELARYADATDLIGSRDGRVGTRGDSFNLGFSKDGQVLGQFVTFKPLQEPEFFLKDNLVARVANAQADVMVSLSGSSSTPLVRDMASSIYKSQDYLDAIQVHKLRELQLQGAFRNNPAFTGIQNTDFAARDSSTILAAQRLASSVERLSRDAMNQQMLTPLRGTNKKIDDVFARLRTKQSRPSSTRLNHFFTARRGWDLDPGIVKKDGTYRFKLRANDYNKERWRTVYGEEMPKDAMLLDSERRVIQLDELALDGLKAFQQVGDAVFKEQNTLLRTRGFRELRHMDWWIPPEDYTGKYVSFITSPDGRPVMALTADTTDDMQRHISRLQQDSNSILNRPGYGLISQTQVEEYKSLYDQAAIGLLNPNVPVVQIGGKPRTGASLTPGFQFDAWERGIQQLYKSYQRIGRDTIETVFNPQIRLAKARSAVATGPQRNSIFKDEAAKNRTIHDTYLNALLGRSPLRDPKSRVGSVYRPIEAIANNGLEAIYNWSRSHLPFTGAKAAGKEYEQLAQRLGDDMPFKDVNDYISQKFAYSTPPEVAKLTPKLNQMTAGLVLRWFETSHAILNITGMINTSPSVIAQMSRRNGESQAAFAERVGHYSTLINAKSGSVGVLDMTKLMAKAYRDAWDRKRLPEWDRWSRKGFVSQEVAEFNKQMATMTKRADWHQFMSKVDSWIGFLSDRSEDFARSYSHILGYEIGKIQGIRNIDTLDNYAHDFANKVIANYDPINRPEVFQGGIGTPLGLFQSYMLNYYQRIFRYIETGDTRAAATQFAMQGSLFGLVTVPGFHQFNDIINSINSGADNPYDRMYERMDVKGADLLTQGTISNLPVLFGQPGAAFWTRGDTEPRLPGANPFPVLSVAQKAIDSIGEGIDMFRKGHPGATSQEVAELMARAVQNRPLQGMIETFAVGGSTDQRGQLIARETAERLTALYRIMGVRPAQEAKAREMAYMNAIQDGTYMEQRQRLLRSTRSAIRGGNYDKIPDIFSAYIETGGDPASFKQMLREAFISAESTVAERKILETINDADKMNQALRMMHTIPRE